MGQCGHSISLNVSIALCTVNSGLNWRQKFFVAWVAPRGIVSASVASLFAILLTREGITGGEAIKALVFLTIMITVFVQGLTARWVAQGLKITSALATGAVIIGCNPLGRLLGRLFQEQGESVVLIDTDPEDCQKAKAENLLVFQSSGLDPQVLQDAGIASVGTFIALTHNSEVNLVLAQRAIEEFQPPRVFAIFASTDQSPQTTSKTKINQAFIEKFSVKTWTQYLNEGQFQLGKTQLKEEIVSTQKVYLQGLIESGELLPLLIKRKNTLYVVSPSEAWQIDDELIYLLHDPRPPLLKRLSGNHQTTRLLPKELPEVEKIPAYKVTPADTQ